MSGSGVWGVSLVMESWTGEIATLLPVWSRWRGTSMQTHLFIEAGRYKDNFYGTSIKTRAGGGQSGERVCLSIYLSDTIVNIAFL